MGYGPVRRDRPVVFASMMVSVLGLPPVLVPRTVQVLEVLLAFGLPLAAALVTLSRHAATDFEGG